MPNTNFIFGLDDKAVGGVLVKAPLVVEINTKLRFRVVYETFRLENMQITCYQSWSASQRSKLYRQLVTDTVHIVGQSTRGGVI